METVKAALAKVIKETFDVETDILLTRPDSEYGDFATNVAMQLAKPLSKNPRDIADVIISSFNDNKPEWLQSISVAGPGFLNILLADSVLTAELTNIIEQQKEYGRHDYLSDQTVITEYLDPNPFKELHIGHAYSGTIGDAISHLYELAGARVVRVTYQGDVGLHVAKALYGIFSQIGTDINKLESITESDRPAFLGTAYAAGAKAYEEDELAKSEIVAINKKVYSREDSALNAIYKLGKKWSLDYFNAAYQQFDFTPFEKNYMEGAVATEGLKLVREHISDGIFVESDGAVVFEGEKHGLHTRVFINSAGLPTYEAKDLGNAMLKHNDYNYDRSIIITASEQSEYFKVMLKALEQFAPDQARVTRHIAHGMVRLSSGKMSSRTGQVVRALDVLESATTAAKKLASSETTPVRDNALAAIKYSFLKNRIGGDVVYDVEDSVSLEGNSGPYLQYAHARACSILAKKSEPLNTTVTDLTPGERELVAKLSEYPEVTKQATEELHPHIICTYLYELCQTFNRFYENNRVLNDSREAERLVMVSAYRTVLANGLAALRIPAPERM